MDGKKRSLSSTGLASAQLPLSPLKKQRTAIEIDDDDDDDEEDEDGLRVGTAASAAGIPQMQIADGPTVVRLGSEDSC